MEQARLLADVVKYLRYVFEILDMYLIIIIIIIEFL